MLKRCLKNINFGLTPEDRAAAAEAAAAAYQACIAQYKGCVLTKKTHQEKADAAKKNAEEAEANVELYDAQITELTEKQTNLGNVRGEYEAFQSSLNEAWTGYADLNGYTTLGEDMKCIQDFCDGIDTMLTTLETEKETWKTYAEEQRKIEETEQTAANNITCVNNC